MMYSKFAIAMFALSCVAPLCHAEQKFTVTSTSFADNGQIPAQYTLIDDNINLSPQLSWENAPAGTKNLSVNNS